MKGCERCPAYLCNGREGTSFLGRRGFGPLRVNHYFAFVDAAKIDKDNGQYYQIGIIKYNFLD
jgi:hypothetical protein